MKNYKRISIIGPNSAGKTTLSRVLKERLSLPIVHMDSYIWGKDWKLNDRVTAENKIRDLLQNQDSWIAEGYITYADKEMLELPDLVIYLNYGTRVTFFHNIKRWLEHRKIKREELAEGCEERLSIEGLNHILHGDTTPLIEKTLTKYHPRNMIRIRSPRKLKVFLKENF